MIGKIYIHNNVMCVICQRCEEEMRRVGAVYFCTDCCEVAFTTDDPVRKEREKYLQYLHLQMEQIG